MRKRSRARRNLGRLGVLGGLLLLTAACASAPTQEMVAARAAVDAARQAEASTYASVEFKLAEQGLEGAEARVKAREYSKARQAALAVRERAEKAESLAIRNRIRAEVERVRTDASAARAAAEAATGARQQVAQAVEQAQRAQEEATKAAEAAVAAKSAAEAAASKAAAERLQAERSAEMAGAHRRMAERAAAARAAARRAALGVDIEEAEEKGETAARTPAGPAGARAAREPVAEYVVQEGDTLWGIAGNPAVYNDPFLWPLLHRANQGEIENPDLIPVGLKLKVSRQASPEEVREARKAAGAPEPYTPPAGAIVPQPAKAAAPAPPAKAVPTPEPAAKAPTAKQPAAKQPAAKK
ncbi:MAG: LysM peptidoglycan-binding domain-containing protein [Deltaproteobacteria bacterium]|nr:LysM peptidoglycan-binding domain-containing protein [Deltaproteobacteria bacterium]MBI3079340.1 LysM peptidoglycan-binding domain-containing protein [Deltaproteobacteria bacterium]